MDANNNQPGPYKEFKHRVIDDALRKSKYRPAAQDEVDKLMAKTEVAVAATLKVIRPIVSAGGAVKDEDRNKGLRPLVFQCLLEQLDSFHREDLHTLCTILIAERIMQDVEARPWGGGTPDLLSGQ